MLASGLSVVARTATAAALLAIAAGSSAQPATLSPDQVLLLNRLTWGADDRDARRLAGMGTAKWIDSQLHPSAADAPAIPPSIAAEALLHQVQSVEAMNQAANGMTDPDRKAAARKAYQDALGQLGHQAAARSILRAIYAPAQLQEQLTWFWFNHFNVHLGKSNIRAMVGDYEDRAIRPHALGRFRDLLEATVRHPAMLRYLDNADNAAGHINENYAREIMELHTMGVGSGYSQADVQELARILTGVGIDARPQNPGIKPEHAGDLIRDGLFEFNPNRHDYGDKQFLGHHIRGRGFGEVEEALDILAEQPATATHVASALARYFVADTPPPALVARMATTFRQRHGDIAAVMGTMIASPEFKASLGTQFKDPVHYVLSGVRLAYADRTIVNAQPIEGWMNRLAEAPYNHQTPDGYPMDSAAWDGPGQLATRFEVARQIAGGAPALFAPPPPPPPPPGAMLANSAGAAPAMASAAPVPSAPAPSLAPPVPPSPPPPLRDRAALLPVPSAATQAALAQARSVPEYNLLLLSSPEFMRR